ncbi:MAG: universal stress protein [Halorientalis sp.]
MYDRVLVPTDGSEHAVRAAEHATHLAGLFDATVHLVHVVDLSRAAGPFDAGGVDEAFLDRLEAEGERTIADNEDSIDAPGEVQTSILDGNPVDEILEYAADHDIELLAMGTHGRTGVKRAVAGSVTERVVRLADVPVLTVRNTERSGVRGEYEEVLVPTDGSDYAEAAVDHAIAIAEAAGARIHALNVVDLGDLAVTPEYSPPPDVIERLESRGEDTAERVADRARSVGLDAVTHVQEGLPARDILEYVDEHDVDFVGMGTAGRTGLTRYLLGSTTERVVRHAEVPVLTVNARNATQ